MTVDGVQPEKIVAPRSVEELSEVIRSETGSLVPMGAGSQLHFGNPLRSAGTVLHLKDLRRITAYNPAELTIHVEAGATLGEIQGALAENGQALPLDPWNGPAATIGGIAATNAQGPLRTTGTIRDWIIGMTVVHADGRITRTGGRVVKNVTGYDLAKLYTGSLGTLAVIAEISFKLRPRFERTVTAVAEFESSAAAAAAVRALRTSPVQPISCVSAGPSPRVWVRFGEQARAVDWQLTRLPEADWRTAEGEEEVAVWENLRQQHSVMGPIVLRVVGLPSEVEGIIESYQPEGWLAHALNGILLIQTTDEGLVQRIRERFPVVIESAPRETRGRFGTFGIQGPAKRLIQNMKKTFDPEGRLNPGRHIDGE